jgi:outer membrane protein OmpA-like peptidoglycan-associated protein
MNYRVNCFLIVFTTLILFTQHKLSAQDIPEHPVIKPFPNSVLAENMSKYNKFDQFEFFIQNKKTKQREKINVKGQYWKLLYEVRKPNGERVQDISTVEFLENYKNAALEKGGEVLWEDRGVLDIRIPRDDGGNTYCQIMPSANLGQIYLNIIDEKGFKQSLTFGVDDLKSALDKDGKVILYGILFDLDKASLKQESVKQLSNMVALLLKYPTLKIEIQGHTDNQGKDDYNMKLSKNRAETVSSYLQLFGVDKNRLVSKGFGESKPIASNDTEEGRAQNRRVELIKIK